MDNKEKGDIGENFVNKIAYDSFLEHWCYPSPYDENGDRKEICDLLIIFGDSLLIVSVKNYVFKDIYSRYFRQTIDKAVKQIYGAERKLFNNDRDIFIRHPNRGIERFPKEKIKIIQRIIVNLGESVKFYPFNKETPDEKFITIWDKKAFQYIIQELDTIPDIIEYLKKREALFTNKNVTILPGDEIDFSYETAMQFFEFSQKAHNSSIKKNILISGTELDLLANYLKNDRNFPEYLHSNQYNGTLAQLDENWDNFIKQKQVIEKKQIDKTSYFIDELVKREVLTTINKDTIELATEIMMLNRFERRIVSNNFLQFYHNNRNIKKNNFARRYSNLNGTGIVLVIYTPDFEEEQLKMLFEITLDSFALNSNYESGKMILIATTCEFKQFKIGLMKDIVPFSKDRELQIQNQVEQLGWFKNITYLKMTEKEYPDNE